MTPALEGPVSVCIERQSLSLDRPFTYLLPSELRAGLGSLVKVPFHGRRVNGWVLGATDDVPKRMLPVSSLASPVRFFDERRLEVFRWVSERYVASLASVISRSHPPRVVSEEVGWEPQGGGRPEDDEARHATPTRPPPDPSSPGLLDGYRNGYALREGIATAEGAFMHRPAPREEATCAVEAVRICLGVGRRAVVLVPEFDPLPSTTRAVLELVGDRGVLFAGGDKRDRYRMWLDILAGRYDVVVGTRPAVFAPLENIGLFWISRESHALHREERSPYYHVRDVALQRGRTEGAAVVMSAFCPSAEAVTTRALEVAPAGRAWPPVQVAAPGPEGRSVALMNALKTTRGAFLFEPMRGYGVARVCKSCREPASCAACGGLLRQSLGVISCAVCGAEGRCANCGGSSFGISRGGAERVEEWAAGVSTLPVREASGPPPAGQVTVGGATAVKDFEVAGLDLVAIVNADVAASRPGMSSAEHTLAVWMEAASWAGRDGRVIVHTRHAGDPSIQSLVSGNPSRFYRSELARREQAGFPAGHPVFKVTGTAELGSELARLPALTLLTSRKDEETICLISLRQSDVATFGRSARELAERGVVTRVEAEPHL
jgi:primosomal protein N' (replication factor Y)